MKHIWTVLCQNSSIDFEKNLVSIFNCIEEVNLTLEKPEVLVNGKFNLPIEFQLISFWSDELPKSANGSMDMKIEILDPDGMKLHEFVNKLEMKAGSMRLRNRTNIQGLTITKGGRYYFRISQKEEGQNDFTVVTNLPLDVKISFKFPLAQKK